MARPKTIIVAALAGPPPVIGKVFDATEFADAIFLASQAKTAGYDGTIYCVRTMARSRRSTPPPRRS
jgi:hypothetical protein